MFCKKCGTLLLPKDGKIVCSKCGTQRKISKGDSYKMTKSGDNIAIINGTKPKKRPFFSHDDIRRADPKK